MTSTRRATEVFEYLEQPYGRKSKPEEVVGNEVDVDVFVLLEILHFGIRLFAVRFVLQLRSSSLWLLLKHSFSAAVIIADSGTERYARLSYSNGTARRSESSEASCSY